MLSSAVPGEVWAWASPYQSQAPQEGNGSLNTTPRNMGEMVAHGWSSGVHRGNLCWLVRQYTSLVEIGKQNHTPPLKRSSALAGRVWEDAIVESWLDRLAGDSMRINFYLVCIYIEH